MHRPALRCGPIVFGATAVVVLGLMTLSPAAVAGSPSGWEVSGPSWTNGVVLCNFSAALPGVAVSALGRSESGLSGLFSGVSEYSATGALVGAASSSNRSWVAENWSSSQSFDEGYTSQLALFGPTGARVGSVDAAVDFDLPGTTGSSSGAMSAVTSTFSISNWSAAASGDHLALDLSFWPTFPSTERLTRGSFSNATISSVSSASGATRESVTPSAVATVGWTNGTMGIAESVPRPVVAPTAATIEVEIRAPAGAVRSLSYSVVIGVVVPPSLGGLPWFEYVLVVAGGSGVSVVLAVWAHRLRRRPSSLEFVEEGCER